MGFVALVYQCCFKLFCNEITFIHYPYNEKNQTGIVFKLMKSGGRSPLGLTNSRSQQEEAGSRLLPQAAVPGFGTLLLALVGSTRMPSSPWGGGGVLETKLL